MSFVERIGSSHQALSHQTPSPAADRKSPTIPPACVKLPPSLAEGGTGRASPFTRLPVVREIAYVARVLWLHRPPYLRWIAAALLVLGAVALDLTQRATEPYPFVAAPIERGQPIDGETITWRDIPVGLLTAPPLEGAVASHRLEAGEPVLASSVGSVTDVPADWWSVPMVLPDGVAAGALIRVVTVDPPLTVDGIVVSVSSGDAFTPGNSGLVAVPEAASSRVAAAAIAGTATVLFSP